MKDYPSDWATTLVDSKVSLDGVLAALFTEHRQVTGVRIFVPSRVFMHIDERAPSSPFDLPESSALSVGAFSTKQDWSHRIRVRGNVTAVVSRSLIYVSQGESKPPCGTLDTMFQQAGFAGGRGWISGHDRRPSRPAKRRVPLSGRWSGAAGRAVR